MKQVGRYRKRREKDFEKLWALFNFSTQARNMFLWGTCFRGERVSVANMFLWLIKTQTSLFVYDIMDRALNLCAPVCSCTMTSLPSLSFVPPILLLPCQISCRPTMHGGWQAGSRWLAGPRGWQGTKGGTGCCF